MERPAISHMTHGRHIFLLVPLSEVSGPITCNVQDFASLSSGCCPELCQLLLRLSASIQDRAMSFLIEARLLNAIHLSVLSSDFEVSLLRS